MIELAKFIIQFIGALLIAKLTVNWALDRFKSEKFWERRLSAYGEIISSLTEIRSALDERIDDFKEEPELTPEDEERIAQRAHKAMIRLGDIHATAALLLPRETELTLTRFGEQLQRITEDASGLETSTLDRHALVIETLDKINLQARSSLGIRPTNPPILLEDPFAWFRHKNEIRKSYGDQP
ncbi:hypothetical protein ELG72_28055 (plasmid) [Rhizobium leguminosarum]|uniref:hypothetical protein n=1 Tax=Rhizobium leguminosarum TaxID=384 RepID=UPI00103215E9|nr:hypothetical protein [Rhizobium leguminosarum]MBY5374597.1 hypothetical protein [Rhizobium leguminosarum]TBF25660.1 hypothetical protein ELG92_33025 [Rhizobium leguminosarum]TBF44613.1 hypothetical protein ELG91_32240 [Rhizobium leguminosarum]TBF47865.1 hypothetical protein ELG87_29330 [Rhizobium leguminosarum]TBF48495.1 hypothetical protein ELG90_29910 [Rhizobium leguminosarum]